MTLDAGRLARLQAAERRANWRDRQFRYGTHRRRPYGVVAPQRKPKRKPTKRGRYSKQVSLKSHIIELSAAAVVGCSVVAYFY